jgi:uncharacterized membrane protein YdjX (TVP38/TMEM64 family)
MTRGPHTGRRLIVLAVVVAVVAATLASDLAHERIEQVLKAARDVMISHPVGGKVLFVMLSAASAMLAFFSSAIIVPGAVYAWGDRTTFLLLWMAWLAGGSCSYLIGRTVGPGVFTWIVDRQRVEYYTAKISADAGFFTILLFQLALPSEIPGYVLGAVRYRFATYLTVLALTELPFALGAVYLGDSFVHRRYGTFLAVGAAGLLVTALAVRRFQRKMNETQLR